MFFILKFISFGYTGILIMMLLESSFFPFPLEIVMILAGYLVAQNNFNFIGVIIAGIMGSLLGAYINYFFREEIWKKLLLKYGYCIFLSEKRYIYMEYLLVL